MKKARRTLHVLPLGVAYFLAAAATISMTRYDGGVAFLWIATSLLIADLVVRPRRQWPASIAACAVASVIATGLFGYGWKLAPMLAAANVLEAYVAAVLFRRARAHRAPIGTLPWLGQFVWAAGMVAPGVIAVIAALALPVATGSVLSTYFHFYVGHALGNLTFAPLAIMFARGKLHTELKSAGRARKREAMLLLLLVAVINVAVFAQSSTPLLFLPILPLILVTFRVGYWATAVSVAMIALIGGGFTLAGLGPVHLVYASAGAQAQFFQFFLAAIVTTALPVAADLENRTRLHRKVRLSEARYRLLAEHSTDILLHVDANSRIRFVSPSILAIGGYDPAELIGRHAGILVAPGHQHEVRAQLADTLAAGGESRSHEYLGVTRGGMLRWCETHSRAILDEHGRVDGVLSIVRDISDRKAAEQQLTKDALTDPLTGLPNRRAFRRAAERRAAIPKDMPGDCIALFDIDHFKLVNDRFGHDAGDQVLRNFAAAARRWMRKADLVARFGGEEFVVLLPDTSVEQAIVICERFREEMASVVTMIAGSEVRVTISGGVGAIGEGGVDRAIKDADDALYRAKRGGRDRMAIAA